MKRNVLALALLSSVGIGAAHAADVPARAFASWSASAKKDTISKLVVTPLGSLSFQYAEGIKGFNKQNGLFDVAIEGDTSATEFKLTSRLVTNTLTHYDGSGSTLSVGVSYNGEDLTTGNDVTLIDTDSNSYSGNLGALTNGFNTTGRSTAQDSFSFSITNGTSNGTTPVSDMSQLPEGTWSGDVSVQFDATWTTPNP